MAPTIGDSVRLLGEAICRLLASPYAVSLQKLHNIVTSVASDTLHLWAAGNGCRLETLATVISDEALKGSEYSLALEVLDRFCHVTEFRNSICRRRPLVLTSLLSGAFQPEADPRIHRLCVTVLSSPFPDDIPLPAASLQFLERILDLRPDHGRPDTSWLHAVHAILKVIGPRSMGQLPLQKVSGLQAFVRRVLQSRPVPEYQVQLLGLAIFAHIAFAAPSDDGRGLFSTKSAAPLAGEDLTGELAYSRHYFLGDKSARTLDIAVIGSSRYCSNDTGHMFEEAQVSLKLAAVLGNRVDAARKARWVEGNHAKIQKLVSKIRGLTPGSSLRGSAAQVLVPLLGHVAAARELDVSTDTILSDQLWMNEHERDLSLLTPVLTPSLLETVFDNAARLLTDSCDASLETLSSLSKLQVIIGHLCGLVPSNAETVRLLSSSFSSNTLRSKLLASLRNSVKSPMVYSDPATADKAGGTFCPNALFARQERLKTDLCVLISISCAAVVSDVATDTELVTAAVQWLATRTGASVCNHPVAFQQAKGTTIFGGHSTGQLQVQSTDPMNWNDGLRQKLHSAADVQHENFVQTWTSVCRDLEARCEHVEMPLRQERKRAELLDADLVSERSLTKSLRDKMTAQGLRITKLEKGNANLTDEVQSKTAEATRLSQEAAGLREELNHAQCTISEQASLNRDKELKAMGELTAMAEDLEQASRRLSVAQTAFEDSKYEVSQLRDEVNEGRHDRQTAQTEKESLVEEARASEQEKHRLRATVAGLETNVTQLRAETEETEERHQERERALEAKILSLQSAASASDEQHVNELQARDSEVARLKVALSEQEEASRRTLENEKASRDLRIEGLAQREAQLANRVRDLQDKLENVDQVHELLNRVYGGYTRKSSATPPVRVPEDPETPDGATTPSFQGGNISRPLGSSLPPHQAPLSVLSPAKQNALAGGQCQIPQRQRQIGEECQHAEAYDETLKYAENLSFSTNLDLSSDDKGHRRSKNAREQNTARRKTREH